MRKENVERVEKAARELGAYILWGNFDFKPNDLYLACKRTDGVQLLTVDYFDRQKGIVFPLENGAYPFNVIDCVLIKEI